MFYKIRNILCLTVLALLLVQTNITKLYAQGVVTLADNAENEDPALNQDIPDEIALFDDSIESEVPSEVPAEAGNAAPSTPDSVKAPEEKQTPTEKVVEEDISVEDIIAAAPGHNCRHHKRYRSDHKSNIRRAAGCHRQKSLPPGEFPFCRG